MVDSRGRLFGNIRQFLCMYHFRIDNLARFLKGFLYLSAGFSLAASVDWFSVKLSVIFKSAHGASNIGLMGTSDAEISTSSVSHCANIANFRPYLTIL